MPEGERKAGKGRLSLKGGEPWAVKKKRAPKKHKEKPPELDDGAAAVSVTTRDGQHKINLTSVDVQSNQTYEDAFGLQMERAKAGKARSTPWGSSYRAPPEILHGYSHKVEGVTAAERLDLRCAAKADKFCK